MKKIITIILALILTLSLCACSNDRIPTASAAELAPTETTVNESLDEIILYEGEFTVVRTAWSYGGSSHADDHYNAVLEHNGNRLLIAINEADFACWDEGETLMGKLTCTYGRLGGTFIDFYIDGREFRVEWSQVAAELQN